MFEDYGVKRATGTHWTSAVPGWLIWTGVTAVVGFGLMFVDAVLAAFITAPAPHLALGWALHGPAGVVPGAVGPNELLAMSAVLAAIGLVFGLLQRPVLQFLGIPGRRWVLATVVGGALAPLALYGLGLATSARGYSMSWVQLGPMGVTLIGVCGWLALRSQVAHTRWLIPAVAVAWLLPSRSIIGVYILALGPFAGAVVATVLSQLGPTRFLLPAPLRVGLQIGIVALASVAGVTGPRSMAANIELAASTDHWVERPMVATGTRLYTADATSGDRLIMRALDLQNPAQPLELGTLSLPSWSLQTLTSDGDTPYLAATPRGDNPAVVTLDISGPQRPGPPFSAPWPAPAPEPRLLAATHDRAYQLSGDRLHTVDLSDSAGPVLLTSQPLSAAQVYHEIAALGTYAYVIGTDQRHGRRLWVVDLARPERPAVVGMLDVRDPIALAAADRYLYLIRRVPYPYYTVEVLDVAEPTRPALRGFYELGALPSGIAASGSTAYLAQQGRLLTLRFTTPSEPGTSVALK